MIRQQIQAQLSSLLYHVPLVKKENSIVMPPKCDSI